jgi:hypothetical protein
MGPTAIPPRFDRYFLVLDNRTGGRWDVNLADFLLSEDGTTWDSQPSSLIVVHTAQAPEVRISAAEQLTPIWNDIIDVPLKDANGGPVEKVSRNGTPEWSWVAFPINMDYLNPNLNYLKVSQDLYIKISAPFEDCYKHHLPLKTRGLEHW